MRYSADYRNEKHPCTVHGRLRSIKASLNHNQNKVGVFFSTSMGKGFSRKMQGGGGGGGGGGGAAGDRRRSRASC